MPLGYVHTADSGGRSWHLSSRNHVDFSPPLFCSDKIAAIERERGALKEKRESLPPGKRRSPRLVVMSIDHLLAHPHRLMAGDGARRREDRPSTRLC